MTHIKGHVELEPNSFGILSIREENGERICLLEFIAPQHYKTGTFLRAGETISFERDENSLGTELFGVNVEAGFEQHQDPDEKKLSDDSRDYIINFLSNPANTVAKAKQGQLAEKAKISAYDIRTLRPQGGQQV